MTDDNIKQSMFQHALLHKLNRIANALERLALCEEKMIDSCCCSSDDNDNDDDNEEEDLSFRIRGTGSLQPGID